MKKFMTILALGCCVACSDDPGTSDTDDGGTDDTGNNTRADMGPEDTGGGEDVLYPEDSDMPNDMSVSEDVGSDTGVDMADAGVDMGEPLPPLDIEWPDDTELFADTANATYMATMALPPLSGGSPTCCVDFGEKSRNEGIDNAFALLADTLLGFDFDLNMLLQDSLASGAVAVLLDHRELDGADDPDGFVLSWLRGDFQGTTDYPTAASGSGTFLLEPASLDANGEPLLFFNPAEMSGGAMSAGPDQLSLALPFVGTTLELNVEEASISGDATIGGDGVSYENGTMAGYITVEEILTGINEVVAAECACLGLGATPLYEQDADGDWVGNCVTDPELVCPGNDLCQTLGGDDIDSNEACRVTRTFLPQLADIDTNGDKSKYEAVSIGLEWTGVPASVVGVAQ